MAKLKFVSPADRLFLMLESPQQPMQIGTLMLFSYPEGEDDAYPTRLAARLLTWTDVYPPFNKRVVRRYGQEFWEEDVEVDLEHHFHHAALPAPGRIRELLAYVSAEHSHLLDRERPLWEFHLIEGLQGRQFAVYTKVHHALMDGMSGIRLIQRAYAGSVDVRGAPPVWALPPRERRWNPAAGEAHKPGKPAVGSGIAERFLRAVPKVVKEVGDSLSKTRHDVALVAGNDAPQSILNSAITGSRRFAAQSYSISRVREIARAHGGTVNDAVLAICGGALREYLLGIDQLPEKSLVAMVPVSVREGHTEGGNQIAVIHARLGTDIADPAKRIAAVVESVQHAKGRSKRMGPQGQQLFTGISMLPAGANMITGGRMASPGFNVIISNVPGPSRSLHWNGARLEGLYPISLVVNRLALNITLFSYRDNLEFGITACRRAMPSVQKLLMHIEAAIDELEKAVPRQ